MTSSSPGVRPPSPPACGGRQCSASVFSPPRLVPPPVSSPPGSASPIPYTSMQQPRRIGAFSIVLGVGGASGEEDMAIAAGHRRRRAYMQRPAAAPLNPLPNSIYVCPQSV